MLSVILACDDPYRTADLFVTRLGWRLKFATPRESDDRLACVALGDDQVMLGTADEQFLPTRARPHLGAGVEVYIRLPDSLQIEDVYHRHAMANLVTRPLEQREWGELAFQFEVDGYHFMITQVDAPSAE